MHFPRSHSQPVMGRTVYPLHRYQVGAVKLQTPDGQDATMSSQDSGEHRRGKQLTAQGLENSEKATGAPGQGRNKSKMQVTPFTRLILAVSFKLWRELPSQ